VGLVFWHVALIMPGDVAAYSTANSVHQLNGSCGTFHPRESDQVEIPLAAAVHADGIAQLARHFADGRQQLGVLRQ